jgi:tetratricopeptide (TPR) repeat protein
MMSNLAADNNERRRLLRESEAGLRLCLDTDPTDPRAYVSLGRILLQQKRYDEARKLYADGTSNTGARAAVRARKRARARARAPHGGCRRPGARHAGCRAAPSESLHPLCAAVIQAPCAASSTQLHILSE